MPKKGPSTIKERVKRAVGQVNAVASMIDRGESTDRIVMQIRASVSSLEAIKAVLLKKKIKDSIIREVEGMIEQL